MSTVTLKYSPNLDPILTPFKEQIRSELIEATAGVLNADPSGVIIDFEPWGEPSPTQAPDILFRAETSLRRRELLQAWGMALITRWKSLVKELKLPIDGSRVAAKTYVIDLEWVEMK